MLQDRTFMKMKKLIVCLFVTIILASCSKTSMIKSWKDPEKAHVYKHLMVIGISDSQQTRQLYEKYLTAEFLKKKIVVTPSYTLINSKQKMNRETVVAAIKDTDIDAVLVTYLVSADVEIKHRDSPLTGSYSGSAEGSEISATIITNRGRSRSEEIFVLKNDVFDARSKTLVWSIQTRTAGPESIDEVIADVTELLIERLMADGIIIDGLK